MIPPQKTAWDFNVLNGALTFWNTRWFQIEYNLKTRLLIVAAAAKSLQSYLTLCDPRDSSPPGSPVPGVLQARTLEWVAISFSNAWKWKVKVNSLSPVWGLRDSMDCSLPGTSVHGIFQARVLEWNAIAFSEITHYCIPIAKNWQWIQKSTRKKMVKLIMIFPHNRF